MNSEIINGLIIVCGIGFLVSSIVEVLKTVFNIKNQYIINILVLILNEILVVCSLLVYCQTSAVAMTWYYMGVAIIGGIISTGISIFGFDKFFKPLFENIKKLIDYFGK